MVVEECGDIPWGTDRYSVDGDAVVGYVVGVSEGRTDDVAAVDMIVLGAALGCDPSLCLAQAEMKTNCGKEILVTCKGSKHVF